MTAPAGSEPTTEGRPASGRRGGFTLPTWGWIAVAVGGVGFVAWYYIKGKNGAAAAAPAATTGTATASGYTSPTTILPIFQGSTAGTNSLTNAQFQQLQQANPPLPDAVYTVKGTGAYAIPTQAGGPASNGGTINDQWPAGAVIAAYNLSPTDLLNISVYSTLLMIMNPGLTAPYPVGTQLNMPYNGTSPPPNSAPDPSSPKPQSPSSAETNVAFNGNNGTSYLSSSANTNSSTSST